VTAFRRFLTLAAATVLPAASACVSVHAPSFLEPAPRREWPATLSSAEARVSEGNFAAADSLLAQFAARYPKTSEGLEATYWRARRTENLLLVHYNDLKADLEGEMRRIAGFLAIEPPRDLWPRLVEAATFEAMKRHGETILARASNLFEGGADRFFFKGANGRWRELMTGDDLVHYEQACLLTEEERWTASPPREPSAAG